jgi:hypothetical protein
MKRSPILFSLVTAVSLLLLSCGGDVVDGGPLVEDTTTTTTDADDPGEDPAAPDPDPDPAPAHEPADDAADDTVDDTDGATESEPGTDEDPGVAQVRLYFIAPGGGNEGRADPFLVAVQRDLPSTPRIALATLRALIDGPTEADRALIGDVSSAVPGETLLLGVAIEDRIATVDLSREFESGGGSLSMFARLAQVVYTVSQWPTVDEVVFELDGEPVTVFSNEGIMIDGPADRSDFLDLLPRVFVDAPAAGSELRSGDRITGVAAVFEATFEYRLANAVGEVLARGFESTDNGTGWGAFEWALTFDVDQQQPGVLTVWEESARDGSDQAVRHTPVVLVP